MEKLLNQISSVILDYREMNDTLVFNDTEVLSGMLKNLSSDLFFLEKYRDEYARKYNAILYTEIKEGKSVSGADIIAKERVPELYQLRRLMTSAYKVQDAIRTNISFLKNER